MAEKIRTPAQRQADHRKRREASGYRLIHVDLTPVAVSELDRMIESGVYKTKGELVSAAIRQLGEKTA